MVEFTKGYKEAFPDATDETIQSDFNNADCNGDGYMSPKEFERQIYEPSTECALLSWNTIE